MGDRAGRERDDGHVGELKMAGELVTAAEARVDDWEETPSGRAWSRCAVSALLQPTKPGRRSGSAALAPLRRCPVEPLSRGPTRCLRRA